MNRLLSWLTLIVVLPFAVSAQAEDVAGKVGYMSGALVSQRVDGTVKVMGPNAEIFEGDLLVTAKDSYAQVVMNDGSKMTLRPDSNLKIEAFQFKKESPLTDNAVFRLLKGGFRTVTGLIGKRGNPDAYKLRAKTSTIGIRGTDFTTRLCATQNCQDDSESEPVKPAVETSRAVGRVMLIRGELLANELRGSSRKLALGAPVYEGDTLKSSDKSYAVVVFRDGGRITLQENSDFLIEKYKYEKTTSQESATLRLLRGGVRVVTGLIGRFKHENFNFGVGGATIGIRGTGFDAWCNGPCAEGKSDFGATPGKPLDGAGVYVWAGEVVLVSPGGSFTVAINQAAIIARETGKPVQIMVIPASIKDNPIPKPDSFPVDIDKLFDEISTSGEPGLYVTVHDGQVILALGDQKIDLGRGESGFTNDEILTRLSNTPGFMRGDKRLDNLESIGGSNSALPGGGCVVGP
ncbi:MAG: FecR domain-containing protein [Nitrosomonadales bacterium]|nr:FecR domain-containing protein [Nitrosomonadales bacterium]